MTSNPMQRKSRNSFLLGIIITLLITGVLIAGLLFMLNDVKEQLRAETENKKKVYVLKQDVSAGTVLTYDMFVKKDINKDSIPSNATSDEGIVDSWFLQTKEGEKICRNEYGLYYLDRRNSDKAPDTIIEVFQNEGREMKDSNGNRITTGDYYSCSAERIEKITSLDKIQKDSYESGMFIIDENNDEITSVYQEELTDEFYVYKIDTTTRERVKEYITIQNVPVIARVDMKANTVVTEELIVQSSEIVTKDTRQEEYNVVVLPVDLMTDDYVDIRLMTPQGQNFIVISKARVEVPQNDDGTYMADTIKMNLREDEILAMSSAIVEAAGLKGSKLYADKYVDPAMQEAAKPTYRPNKAVQELIQPVLDANGKMVKDEEGNVKFLNPNIVQQAVSEINSRYAKATQNARENYLQQQINNMNPEEFLGNSAAGVENSIGASITARKKYLDSLNY